MFKLKFVNYRGTAVTIQNFPAKLQHAFENNKHYLFFVVQIKRKKGNHATALPVWQNMIFSPRKSPERKH